MQVKNPKTGQEIQVVELAPGDWKCSTPPAQIGPILVSEGVALQSGTAYCFWIGNRTPWDPEVGKAMEGFLAGKRIYRLFYIRGLPNMETPAGAASSSARRSCSEPGCDRAATEYRPGFGKKAWKCTEHDEAAMANAQAWQWLCG